MEMIACRRNLKFSRKANIKTDGLITTETTVEIYSRFEVTADIF